MMAAHRAGLMVALVLVLALPAVGVMAQGEAPAVTAASLVSDAVGLLNGLGVMPIIFAGAVIGGAVYLLRRVKTGAR